MLEKVESHSLPALIAPFRGRKRQYLLLRIAGLTTITARTELGIAERTLQNWKNEEEFALVEDNLYSWRSRYQTEVLDQLRQDNRAIGVLIERRTLLRLAEELDTGDYVLIKTRFGRDVYKNLMAVAGTTEGSNAQTWQQLIAGVVNVQTGNYGQTTGGSTTQRSEGNTDESNLREGFDCEAEVVSEGVDDN